MLHHRHYFITAYSVTTTTQEHLRFYSFLPSYHSLLSPCSISPASIHTNVNSIKQSFHLSDLLSASVRHPPSTLFLPPLNLPCLASAPPSLSNPTQHHHSLLLTSAAVFVNRMSSGDFPPASDLPTHTDMASTDVKDPVPATNGTSLKDAVVNSKVCENSSSVEFLPSTLPPYLTSLPC